MDQYNKAMLSVRNGNHAANLSIHLASSHCDRVAH